MIPILWCPAIWCWTTLVPVYHLRHVIALETVHRFLSLLFETQLGRVIQFDSRIHGQAVKYSSTEIMWCSPKRWKSIGLWLAWCREEGVCIYSSITLVSSFAGNFKSQTRKFKSFPSLLQSFLFGSPPEDVFSHFDSGRASTTSHFFVEPCAPLHLNLWMTWDVRNLVSLTFFTLRITGSILPFIVPSNLHATLCRLWDGESSSGIMWDERRLAGFHLTCPEKTKTGNWLNHRPRPCR